MLKNTFIFNFLIELYFILFFTPISFVLKIFKYDPLQINLEKKKHTGNKLKKKKYF